MKVKIIAHEDCTELRIKKQVRIRLEQIQSFVSKYYIGIEVVLKKENKYSLVFMINKRLMAKQRNILAYNIYDAAGLDYQYEKRKIRRHKKELEQRKQNKENPQIFNGFTGNLCTFFNYTYD